MERFIKDEDMLHAVVIFLGWMMAITLGNLAALILMTFIAFLIFIKRNARVFTTIKPFGGYANWITLFRLFILLTLGLIYTYLSDLEILIIAGVALCLDGVDGILARKFNMQSDFGGKLDGETDAFFVLMMSTIIYLEGILDSWVLWAGLLRYLFVIICYAWWKGIKPEPPSMLRKTIAVIIMAAMLTPFILSENLYYPIIIAASVLVTFSFGKSFIFQMSAQKT